MPLRRFGSALLPQRYSSKDALQVLGGTRRRALGPVIRCLVWNILKARRARWARDFESLVADRDLVLLQEAVLRAPSDALFTSSERLEWVMARSFRDPRSGVEHGIKTGCAVPASACGYFLSPHAEPVSNTHKLLLATHYPLEGERETLLVLNMHAINFVTIAKYARQLEQLASVLAAHAGPAILAGDFNTWSPARLERFVDVASRAGLEEAAMDRRSRLAHLNSHLDHVFFRGLALRHVASLSHVVSSDHAPITATFVRERPPDGEAGDDRGSGGTAGTDDTADLDDTTGPGATPT